MAEKKKQQQKPTRIKSALFVFGLLVIVVGLSYLTVWRFKKWKETLPKELPRIETEELKKIPKFFSPENFEFPLTPGEFPENLPLPEEIPFFEKEEARKESKELEEFISPDGKFKIKYPAKWLKLERDFFKKAIPEELEEKYQFKFLLLAQKFGTYESGQFVISEMTFEKEKEIEDFIKEMQDILRNYGRIMEVAFIQEKENEAVFEARYLKPNSPNLYSKDKILSLNLNGGKKVFWVEFITLESSWPSLKEEIEKILETAEIIE
jgi:hypothetical protein